MTDGEKRSGEFKGSWARFRYGTSYSATFEEVLSAELAEVDDSRKTRLAGLHESSGNEGSSPPSPGSNDPRRRAGGMKLAGLAFSGGGIRSATFNLGILQGLARLDLLRRFDYLSTVSGGGYIGSWLTAWIKRERSLAAVDEKLRCQRDSGPDYREPETVEFLRKYSNYLTPKLGLLSADTWALIAVYLRNLTLNLLILTAFLLSVFLVPYLVVWYASVLTAPEIGPPHFLFDRAMRFLAIGVFFVSLNQAWWSVQKQRPEIKIGYPWYSRQGSILILVVLPVMMSAFYAGLWLWHFSTHGAQLRWRHELHFLVPVLIGWLAGTFVAGIHANVILARETKNKISMLSAAARETIRTMATQVRDSVKPGFRFKTGAFLISLVGSIAAGSWLFAKLFGFFGSYIDEELWRWYATNFSAPLVMVVYMTIGTILIGLMGREMPDESREWWSRLGGWLLIGAALWTALCTIAFFSAPVIATAKGYVSVAWIVSTISGVLLGKSPTTGGKDANKWMGIASAILPTLFVVGLLMFLSFLASTIMVKATGNLDPILWTMLWQDAEVTFPGRVGTNFFIMNSSLNYGLLVAFCASLLSAAFLSWRVDINQFSIHLLYRNRLVRGYMGASNKNRQGQPFAGFDPDDDLPLTDLQAGSAGSAAGYRGPYPIINTALNLVKGKQLAWQTRKAASFTFTPLYSGYETVPSNGSRKKMYFYRRTSECAKPDGMSLGTAMAISGAAASPNMGYHSSPPLAFLMTVFNVRLGWWSGNPRHEKQWQKAGPVIGLWYMLKELFGLTDDRSGFVYLSDGGHFENLGLYELVKRRCRYIVACDAGQDKDMKFDDLGNAIRKIRIDLGTDITIDVSPIRSGKTHCVLGRIIYHSADGREEYGDLIYIKAVLCGREPADVKNYKALHKEFPHQTTADQWFDEDQFESYRMLGLHTIHEAFERWDHGDWEGLVKRVEEYVEQKGAS